MWLELVTAKEENRHELVLTGQIINERLNKEGLDANLFNLESLNYLNISESSLSDITSDISRLVNLQTLVLHSNKLEKADKGIGKLVKLKVLDLSRNNIRELPDVLDDLTSLVTVNLSHNSLVNFPKLSKNVKLTVLDLSHNKLTKFPMVCNEDFHNLFEVKLSGNQINEIPVNISNLMSLKLLDLSNNKIKVLPGELVDCTKLKDLNLKHNPISDRRLIKLIDQCRTKQILDYIKQNCKKTTNSTPNDDKKDKNHCKCSEPEEYKYTIQVQKADENGVGLQVEIDPSVKVVREHILCCIVKNVKFTEELYKKFIQLQNKLHENVCEKRNAATIATHDLTKLSQGILIYTTKLPNELLIKPLSRNKEMTGAELFSRLQVEANNARKEKKRNTYSGLHKYLYLIEGKARYPCLLNVQSEVISFPPITNSDISKISMDTSSIFIEVTSSLSLYACKKVLDALLKDMAVLFENTLYVQQVKTFLNINGDIKLKNVYPSKVDLVFSKTDNVKVNRE